MLLLAVHDSSPLPDDPEETLSVRDSATSMLAKYWSSDVGTLPLLRELAEKDPTRWLREKAKKLADDIEMDLRH